MSQTESKIDTSNDSKLPLCAGCRDSYYNQPGHTPIGRCWSLANAEVVERFRIGWWTQPTSPIAYRKVVTLNCYHAPGQYAQYEELPACFPGRAKLMQEPAYDARKA